MAPPPDAELSVEFLDAAVELLGRSGRHGTVRVQGLSMLPTLRPGQRVQVEFAPEQPRPGDLLLYRQEDYLVVHRLLGAARQREGGPALRTRGDGLNNLDPRLDPERIVGRVVAVEDPEEADRWLDLTRPPARVYARAVCWHDLFWAAAGVAARRLAAQRFVARLDRLALRLAHGLFFRLCHRRERSDPLTR